MTLLILQMAVILLITLACGWLTRALGQTRVVGEIIGGILLGPSILGRLAPHASSALFPKASLVPLENLSTVGLILFLFLIGTSLNEEHLHREKLTVTLGSLSSILLPFALAALIASALRARFAPLGIAPLPFLLFLGISMSITAFPVLARILEERELHSTPLGATAIMCAAVDDLCAWALLAVAMTLLPASASVFIPARLAGFTVYLLVMLFLIRPLGRRLSKYRQSEPLSYEALGIVLAVVFASAAATEAIGVHPLFGAFLAGLCFPRIPQWRTAVRTRLETPVSLILLPLFFALTGLRTRLDLLTGTRIWLWTALILLLAITGKVGGAVLAARVTGHTWRNALALGALLNTRGLVELIVLNIAYTAGVFSPTLFTMLVVMALVTTMITVPALNLLKIGATARTAPNPARLTSA